MSRPDPAGLLPARAFPEQPALSPAARLQHFLAHYWQQRSLYLPSALAAMDDLAALIDADELAGLACEPGADARIVERQADAGASDGWRYRQRLGPFDPADFEQLGDADWTLLVNAVDLELPGFDPLFAQLRFVPDWRLDDAMVSFAAPGGSVGPHFDHYDVFLVQLQGRRRWELAAGRNGAELPRREETGMNLVSSFAADSTVVCEPGDVLYLPPGMVHHGIAETPCLTLSLGLRAPSAADLLAAWSAELARASDDRPLDLDPALPCEPGRLDPATIDRARELLRRELLASLDRLEQAQFPTWLGATLSRSPRLPEILPPAIMTETGLQQALAAGACLERTPGCRMLLHDAADGCLLFAGGQTFPAAPLTAAECDVFVDELILTAAKLAKPAALRLATELYNAGWLYLSEPGENHP